MQFEREKCFTSLEVIEKLKYTNEAGHASDKDTSHIFYYGGERRVSFTPVGPSGR